MKIAGIVTITNPDYRQDPARECIRQMLEVVDIAIIVYGRGLDLPEVIMQFMTEFPDRVIPVYLEWPQPEWTLDELPKHLNAGLEKAREIGADWCIKFDADYFIHEDDKWSLRHRLEQGLVNDCMTMSLEKAQCTIPFKIRQKGDIPICINLKHPICYGQNIDHYTDLCQPIIWDGKTMISCNDDPKYAIPYGSEIPKNRNERTGVWIWNYGYSFKTYERAKELLYWFDLSHAFWWGMGWYQIPKDEITREKSMEHHLKASEGRMAANKKEAPLAIHPKHIQKKISELTPEEFGHSLWGKIKMPD